MISESDMNEEVAEFSPFGDNTNGVVLLKVRFTHLISVFGQAFIIFFPFFVDVHK